MTNEELNSLNITSWRSVTTTRILVGTSVVVGISFIMEICGPDKAKEIAMRMLDSWLLFLSAALGINTVQYAAKRFSDTGLAAAKASGKPDQTNIAAAGGVVSAPVTGRPSQAQPIPEEPTP